MGAAQYKDPTQERMANGRSLADLMRRGPAGIRGVVVQPSTPGGLPVNFNPHDRASIEIHVEPDSGRESSFKLDQMTASTVEKAMATANAKVQGNDIESIRERAAVAFEELARIAKSNIQRVPMKQSTARPAPTPQQLDDEEEAALAELSRMNEELQPVDDGHNPLIKQPATPPLEKIDRGYSPMAAFGLKKAAMQPTTANSNVAKSTQIGPPQKLVYFEKEGIGTVPAFFHDVLVNVSRPEFDSPEESGFIVLVYDVRFEQSAARWFPPANDPYQRPWAVQINDDKRLYLVHTTGFQYLYDAREYCVLLVEKALRAPEGDG